LSISFGVHALPRSDSNDVVSAFPFLFVLLFELDIVTLDQHITETRILNIAFMEKDIFPARRRYKTETFNRIKKLHNTLRHKPTLLNGMKYNQIPPERLVRTGSEK